MGKRGPKPTPLKELKARGSSAVQKRKPVGKNAPAPLKKRAKVTVRVISDEEMWAGIPGYDPWALAGDCTWDRAAAVDVIEFFHKRLNHVMGGFSGPFVLEPWQKALLGNLFGWKRGDGLRRYRECFKYVGKKNGKTAFFAGVVIYVLTCDGEQGAELYSAAASRDQAALVFQHAAGMVHANPELDARKGGPLKVYGASGGAQIKSIVYAAEGSSYKCLSADANTADGTHSWSTGRGSPP